MNYFTLFQLPLAFELDSVLLSQRYQKLQQLTHPDKFATASESEKLLAVQKNAQVNDGYQVLKSPLSRAEHILNLRGMELAHEQQTMQDNAFLMQQMEWREALMEADHQADPSAFIDELQQQVELERTALMQQLGNLLQEEAQNDRAADHIRKLKFVEKFVAELSEKEDTYADF